MRLILERKAAGKVRKKLEEVGALQKVAPHIPGRRSAIFRWLPCSMDTLRGIRGSAQRLLINDRNPMQTEETK
jgi:hypothetical protein